MSVVKQFTHPDTIINLIDLFTTCDTDPKSIVCEITDTHLRFYADSSEIDSYYNSTIKYLKKRAKEAGLAISFQTLKEETGEYKDKYIDYKITIDIPLSKILEEES